MALPPIPNSALQYIQQAASGTGLPQNVVAAQNYVESSYGSNEGPSVTGAEGPWQFEPQTWSSVSSLPFSDATNWSDSTIAYIKLMSQLLSQYKGNIRDALAAYNAGPGDLSAGYGYADEILSLAGESQTGTATPPGNFSSPTDTASSTSALGGIFSFPSEITGFFKDADTFVTDLLWIVNPAHWLRIGAFFLGAALLIAALVIFTKADQKITAAPIPLPVPV